MNIYLRQCTKQRVPTLLFIEVMHFPQDKIATIHWPIGVIPDNNAITWFVSRHALGLMDISTSCTSFLQWPRFVHHHHRMTLGVVSSLVWRNAACRLFFRQAELSSMQSIVRSRSMCDSKIEKNQHGYRVREGNGGPHLEFLVKHNGWVSNGQWKLAYFIDCASLSA